MAGEGQLPVAFVVNVYPAGVQACRFEDSRQHLTQGFFQGVGGEHPECKVALRLDRLLVPHALGDIFELHQVAAQGHRVRACEWRDRTFEEYAS